MSGILNRDVHDSDSTHLCSSNIDSGVIDFFVSSDSHVDGHINIIQYKMKTHLHMTAYGT